MSHFAVMVIEDNCEEQLQPYHEYECTGIKDEYVKFVEAPETEDELWATYRKHAAEGQSFKDYLHEEYSYFKNGSGAWGSVTNTHKKWDWYIEGGRWSGYLLTKSGDKVNSTRIKDIDCHI